MPLAPGEELVEEDAEAISALQNGRDDAVDDIHMEIKLRIRGMFGEYILSTALFSTLTILASVRFAGYMIDVRCPVGYCN